MKTKNTTMAIKNSTSMNRMVFMLSKANFTSGWDWNYERPAALFVYDPKTSTFVEHNIFTRMRDAYRAMLNISKKLNKDFKVVYIQ